MYRDSKKIRNYIILILILKKITISMCVKYLEYFCRHTDKIGNYFYS